MADYWSNFRIATGGRFTNVLAGGDPPANIQINFAIQKLEWLSYLMLKTAWSYLY